jgi:hypothetical protein
MTLWIDRLVKPSPTNEPPAPREQLRNDLAVAATVIFALILAFGIRNQVFTAARLASLNEGAVRIAYPERWVMRAADESSFTAIRFGSPSIYDSRVEVSSRPLNANETLDLARFDRGLKLTAELPGYRELEAAEMQVLNGTPAIVTTYGFIADPTRDAGVTSLPVVVEAQDVMFLHGEHFYVVSLRADAVDWDANARDFAIVTDSLRLQLPTQPAAASVSTSGFTGGAQMEGGN